MNNESQMVPVSLNIPTPDEAQNGAHPRDQLSFAYTLLNCVASLHSYWTGEKPVEVVTSNCDEEVADRIIDLFEESGHWQVSKGSQTHGNLQMSTLIFTRANMDQ